jgi:hypothetical protein
MIPIYKHLIACCLLLLMIGCAEGQSDFQRKLKAAEQGNASAQTTLGFMYQHGKGVSQDYSEAIQWYRKAAEQGNDWAQNNLGMMYYYGLGVPQNYSEAYVWWNIAAAPGDEESSVNSEIVDKELSPSTTMPMFVTAEQVTGPSKTETVEQ